MVEVLPIRGQHVARHSDFALIGWGHIPSNELGANKLRAMCRENADRFVATRFPRKSHR